MIYVRVIFIEPLTKVGDDDTPVIMNFTWLFADTIFNADAE